MFHFDMLWIENLYRKPESFILFTCIGIIMVSLNLVLFLWFFVLFCFDFFVFLLFCFLFLSFVVCVRFLLLFCFVFCCFLGIVVVYKWSRLNSTSCMSFFYSTLKKHAMHELFIHLTLWRILIYYLMHKK